MYKRYIEKITLDIENLRQNYSYLLVEKNNESSPFEMIVGGVKYTDRSKAGEALKKSIINSDAKIFSEFNLNNFGSYAGMQISLMYDTFLDRYRCRLKGNNSYFFDLGESGIGMIRRIENHVKSFSNEIEKYSKLLDETEEKYKRTESLLNGSYKVFPQQSELDTKELRLKELEFELAM